MKKFFSDFKKFITKGNIIDLAVAVVIGGAFSAIVNSLVNDIIMPLISLAVGGLSIADWKWVIKKATYDEAGNILKAESALHYGNFLQCILNFLIIAFCIFLVLRIIMKAKEGFDKANNEYKTQNKAEYKALTAEMKARGCTKAEIKAEIKKREAARAAAAEAEAKGKAEEAEANKPENVLLQIRDLLAANKPTDGMADLQATQASAEQQAETAAQQADSAK